MNIELHRLVVDVSEAQANELADLLDAAGPSPVSYYDCGGLWRVEILCHGLPTARDTAEFERLARAAGAAGDVRLEPVSDIDWLAENRRQLAPLRIGRFFIHGTLEPVSVPAGCMAVALDAGLAFGTGRHATTALCLEIMAGLARRRRFHRAIDLGTGAGLLAIAAARLWPGRVLATDIDPVAVSVARDNMRANGVAGRVEVVRRDGLKGVGGKFDLVVANILAGPLLKLARDVAGVTERGGVVVLSGLLDHQATAVISRYRSLGFTLRARRGRDGWVALVFYR
ncbi:MAG: 50S ribosomal protein L11 methyltransferase [Alphaproteobacteria bacterium]|nr:50S ribosomal protein L11 methyltransferase [Alphaproteobacteria bacterium]